MNHTSRLIAALGGIALVFALPGCVTPKEEAIPAEPIAPAEPPPPPAKDIWTAAGEGDLAALEAHRAAGTDLDSMQVDLGVTPLLIAVMTFQQAAAEWLVENGADAHALMRDGGNVLHSAAFVGNAAAAEMLLELGVDAEVVNNDGVGVADLLALDWGMTEYVLGLLEMYLAQEDVEAGRAKIAAMLGGGEGDADIWAAVAAADAASGRAALAAGADANAVSPDGSPLLLTVAASGNAEFTAAVLEAGADVNAAHEANGATALHAAAFLGRAEVARVLIEAGADVEVMTYDGNTALSMTELDWPTTEYIAAALGMSVEEEAVMTGRAKIAEMLMAK